MESKHDDESDKCNGSNRLNKPTTSSPPTHSSTVTFIPADIDLQRIPIARSGRTLSKSGTTRPAFNTHEDRHSDAPLPHADHGSRTRRRVSHQYARVRAYWCRNWLAAPERPCGLPPQARFLEIWPNWPIFRNDQPCRLPSSPELERIGNNNMDPLAAQNAAHYYHETQCGLCGHKLNVLVFEGQRQVDWYRDSGIEIDGQVYVRVKQQF